MEKEWAIVHDKLGRERERVSFWEEKAGQTLLELRKLDESEKRGRGVIYIYGYKSGSIQSNLI